MLHPFIRLHSGRRTPLVVAVPILLSLAGCATPASSDGKESVGDVDQAARRSSTPRLSFGATAAQAREGHTTSFKLAATPDLVLHATLASDASDGQTLLLRGIAPNGEVAWSYPHLQKGTSFDAVIPVFASRAARNQTTGAFTFEVTGPTGTVLAAGTATFTAPGVRSTAFQAGSGR